MNNYYNDLIAAIVEQIKPNDNEEITGQIMQNVLLAIVRHLGDGHVYGGIATPDTVIENEPRGAVFYLATERGQYGSFDDITITDEDGEIVVLSYNPSYDVWSKSSFNIVLSAASVGTAQLADEAVTSAKLASQSVTQGKIASNAVVTGKLGTGAVTTPKIADRAVTTEKIAKGAVTNDQLADDSVFAHNIGEAAVTTQALAENAVDSDRMQADAVKTWHITDEAVTEPKLDVELQQKIDSAAAEAAGAKTTADSAAAEAAEAKTTADSAAAEAADAKTEAATAKTEAAGAKTTADNAAAEIEKTQQELGEALMQFTEDISQEFTKDRADIAANKEEIEKTQITVIQVANMSVGARNLIHNSEQIIVPLSGAATNETTYRVFPLPINVKTGDKFQLRVDQITNLQGTAGRYTFRLFDNVAGIVLSNMLTLESPADIGVARTIEVNRPNYNGRADLLIYAGQHSHTMGNRVQFDRVMLVQGDKMTSLWTAAPEDTQAQIDATAQEVAGMQVGGANYINATNQGVSYWIIYNAAADNWTAEEVLLLGQRAMRASTTQAINGAKLIFYKPTSGITRAYMYDELQAGDNVTLSFDADVQNISRITMRFCYSDGGTPSATFKQNTVNVESDGIAHFEWKGVITDNITKKNACVYMHVYPRTTGIPESITIANLKFEEGTMSTSWNPSQVDTDNRFEDTVHVSEQTLAAAAQTQVRKNIDALAGTPSGDPLHYMYELIGATWNASTEFWEIDYIKDITTEQMRLIYLWRNPSSISIANGRYGMPSNLRVSVNMFGRPGTQGNMAYTYSMSTGVELITFSNYPSPTQMQYAFYHCAKLQVITSYIDVHRLTVASNLREMFEQCSSLREVKLYGLVTSGLDLSATSVLSAASVRYLVTNAANTAAITVGVSQATLNNIQAGLGDWAGIAEAAAAKQITFEVPTTAAEASAEEEDTLIE